MNSSLKDSFSSEKVTSLKPDKMEIVTVLTASYKKSRQYFEIDLWSQFTGKDI